MFVVVSRTFSVRPQNWRYLYGNPSKFSQAYQRTISYVPDPLVVTKRHKGQQATSWVTSCCVHHHGSETDTINSNSSGRRQVLCTHSPRSPTSAQNIQQYTAIARKPYNSAAAARWLWSRYSSTTMSMRYHCSKSLGDRTFEMPCVARVWRASCWLHPPFGDWLEEQ